MLVKKGKVYFFISTIFWLLGCIKENNQNPGMLLSIMSYKSPDFVSLDNPGKREACILTSQNTNPKISYCFNVDPNNCNLDFFINFPTSSKIQNRKDDLTFVSINYANCNGATQNLFPTYDSLTPPASMIFKLLGNSNGSLLKNNFSIVQNQSCDSLGFPVKNPNLFSRIITEPEIKSLNNLQYEIGMISSSNDNCLVDLSVPQTVIDFLSSIRNNIVQIGYICDDSVSSSRKCPWTK
jgi:hypothetical protein